MTNRTVLGLATCSLAILVLMSGSIRADAGDWSSPEIIDTRNGEYFASLVIDDDDDLHVAYLITQDVEPGEIVYASRASGSWVKETIAELQSFSGSHPDIAVNQDKVLVNYLDNSALLSLVLACALGAYPSYIEYFCH